MMRPSPREAIMDHVDIEAVSVKAEISTLGLCWSNLTVTVKDTKTKSDLNILEQITGTAKAGGMVALMGPSGSGKTTLLNVLASRTAATAANVRGHVLLDGTKVDIKTLRQLSTYVEQEDALIGSLTVRESIEFAAQLSGAPSYGQRVDELISAFGLKKQEYTKIGTPLQKGISGGQKRRVSIASQLITSPKILFLDEPTSGLDSTAAYEVMARIEQFARTENVIVIASIHQPSTATFNLFSDVVLLSSGRLVYSGPRSELIPYFTDQGEPIPAFTNPAEFLLDICNTDFVTEINDRDDSEKKTERLSRLIETWQAKNSARNYHEDNPENNFVTMVKSNVSIATQTYVLLQRLWLKSYRDLLAYWVRVIMYLGLAILMGTVWLRLGHVQDNIQPFINAIFFSGAFMSFMAVAYIPAFLEDLFCYRKERANGLYGPTAFLISNFLIGIPFIFIITILFAIVTVFLVNFRHDATSFFRYVMWLFLDLLAAESLVVLISSLVPIFVAALAITAFSNGLWMSVGGFLVPQKILNVFWRYTFYWINYQRYVFQGMMFDEFEGREYSCGEGCQCMYASPLQDQCKIAGSSVVGSLGYGRNRSGMWVGILIAIIVAMRFLAWLVLWSKKH